MNIKAVPKKVAKVIAQETLETLKKGREQITATGEYAPQNTQQVQTKQEPSPQPDEEKQKAQAQKSRFFQAYKQELQEIQAKTQEEVLKKKQEEQQMLEQQAEKHPPAPVTKIANMPKGRLGIFKSRRGKQVEQVKMPST